MDKAILKKFAIESRQDLMQKIESKIKLFYVDETFSKQQNGDVYVLSNEKHTLSLSKEEYEKRELLIKRINELGIEQVIEEAAYTWFNRIVAIRYMEINDYLPLTKDNQSLGIRVLSSKDNTPDPEIMKFTNLTNPELDIEFKKEKYIELKDDNEKYKYVLLLVCKKLGRVIPQVFDGITDYIDLLIPDNLLNDSGFINKIISEVPIDSYSQVEIIGWLYQYYNQEEKDRVISAKKTYKKNEIAYATQLFTPDWIVKYMVENSLGRYWIEHNGNKGLIANWKYFITSDNYDTKESIDPISIKCIDPCMGSGHILVYIFEILYQIYESFGYSKKDIPRLILENNLYGLDIDDRAGQLSILSVLLKAREYDKNIFNIDISKKLSIMSIQESNIEDIISFMSANENIMEKINYLNIINKDSKEIGSLMIPNEIDYSDVIDFIYKDDSIFGIEMVNKVMPLIKQVNILSSKYDVVITNPPYLNNSLMSPNLKQYIINNYNKVKSDLFSSFVIKNSNLLKNDGYLGFMTPYVWMFISSYEELRKYIIEELNISSLIQLEYSALEEATVPICSFILDNKCHNEYGRYIRLVDFKGGMRVQEDSYLEIINSKNQNYYFNKKCKQFKNMPNNIISYWLSDNVINLFNNNDKVEKYYQAKQGMTTSDNKRFLRMWYEVDTNKIGFGMKSLKEASDSSYKWFPYNKGGEFRKWYGNNDFVVNYYKGGQEMEAFHNELNKTSSGGRIKNKELYFRKCISWSKISSAALAFRMKEDGFIFDVAGSSVFANTENELKYLLGLYNSKLGMYIVGQISPTLNFEAEQIKQMPFIKKEEANIVSLVDELIKLSKEDWDSFETSWNFTTNPLLKPMAKASTIRDSMANWNNYTIQQRNFYKHSEEELNKIFINIYGLDDELTANIEDKDITIREVNKERDIKLLISYAVGCMFGRYSLDRDGLVFAGGEFDENNYKTFNVDIDNIIPITDEPYFADDIVARFKYFIEVVYGKETLNANLDFIAETLGKKGTETSEETIRRYFLNEFYSDHIKMYQKKPIYWLFDSGKKNGFKALIYMHRYNENTVPKIRLDYLHRVQNTYDKLLTDVNYKLTTDLSVNDKKITQNRQADLNAKLQEITAYDEKIAHIANQRISIDLDDGVTTNYDKFKDILAKIK